MNRLVGILLFGSPLFPLFFGADMVMAQNAPVIINSFAVKRSENGLSVILQNESGSLTQPIVRSQGRLWFADIPNARLRLEEAQSLRQDNPAPGVEYVSIAQVSDGFVRIIVAGTEKAPSVNVMLQAQMLELGVIPVIAQTEQEDLDIVVTGEQDEGYSRRDASTATRTDTPIRDIPFSIQVVPEEVIRDQRAVRLRDALLNVGGVVQEGTFGSSRDILSIRGFGDSGIFGGNILVDGSRDGQFGFRETANLERIEVLKGPASVLVGALEPGGVINLVTKKPLSDPYYNVDLSAGSFSTFRPTIDFSGPLNSEKTLLYRLNSVYETSNGFRDFDQNIQRFFIAPTLQWKISDATSLTLQFNYLDDERPFDRGFIASGNGVLNLPLNRILGEPNDVAAFEELGFSYRLEHNFSDNWKIRNNFRYQNSDTFFSRAEPGAFNPATGILSRAFIVTSDLRENYALQTDLVGKFTTGSVNHTLLSGIDLNRATGIGFQRTLPPAMPTLPTGTPSIDVFNPVYNVRPRPPVEQIPFSRNTSDVTDGLGIFLQDQIAFSDNLKLLVGGRFDIVDQTRRNFLSQTRPLVDQYDTAFTPRVGIVYQPIQPISLYASYSQSFQPNSGIRIDGSFLEPERGTQYEVGVKGSFFNDRLSTTLAAYDITKTNVATPDPANTGFTIPVGEQRNQGIELNVAGEISPGWNVIASYSYIDARITRSNNRNIPAGNRPFNIPFSTASLSTTYQLQSGDLQGLGFGLSLFSVGERQGDASNTYLLPSYLRTDATIFYQRDNWRAAINIQNLFDER